MLKQVVPSLSRVIVPPYQTPLQGPLIPQAIANASQALGAKVEFLHGRGYAKFTRAVNLKTAKALSTQFHKYDDIF